MVKTTKKAAKKPEVKKDVAVAKKVAPIAKPVTKKTVAKKATPVAKPAVKNPVAKKATPVAKPAVKKPVAKKATPVAKPAVKKAVTKKAAPAKKTSVKKPTVKKVAAKKTAPAKKAVVKKAEALKVAAPVEKPVVKAPAFKKERNIFVCYANVFKRYFDFKGRTSRYGYWSFVFINLFIGIILGALAVCCVPYIDSVYSLLVFIPGLAVSFRRLHDVNKSGWWFGLPVLCVFVLAILATTRSIIPYDNPETFYEKHIIYSLLYSAVGFISLGMLLYVFVLSFFKGTKGKNKYGEEPNV